MKEHHSKQKFKIQAKQNQKKASMRKIQAYTEANYTNVINSSPRKVKETQAPKKVNQHRKKQGSQVRTENATTQAILEYHAAVKELEKLNSLERQRQVEK